MTDDLGPIHFHVFRAQGLCSAPLLVDYFPNLVPMRDGPFVGFGQWREAMKDRHKVTCETCLMLLNVIAANRFEPLFDANQAQLGEQLRNILGVK